jgi:hypothetical protein
MLDVSSFMRADCDTDRYHPQRNCDLDNVSTTANCAVKVSIQLLHTTNLRPVINTRVMLLWGPCQCSMPHLHVVDGRNRFQLRSVNANKLN